MGKWRDSPHYTIFLTGQCDDRVWRMIFIIYQPYSILASPCCWRMRPAWESPCASSAGSRSASLCPAIGWFLLADLWSLRSANVWLWPLKILSHKLLINTTLIFVANSYYTSNMKQKKSFSSRIIQLENVTNLNTVIITIKLPLTCAESTVSTL